MNATHSLVQLRHAAPMPIGRILRAYAKEVKYESLRMLRSPAFAIPFLILPVPVYLFFGVVLAGPAVAKNPAVANYLFSGFSVFAVDGLCRACDGHDAGRGDSCWQREPDN